MTRNMTVFIWPWDWDNKPDGESIKAEGADEKGEIIQRKAKLYDRDVKREN